MAQAFSSLHLPLPRHADPSGRGRERDGHPCLQDQGLVDVRHPLVHHGAVPVALHQRGQALAVLAPGGGADLGAPDLPLGEALEPLQGSLRGAVARKVDQRVAEASPGAEVQGQVDQVVEAREPLGVQGLHEQAAVVLARKALQLQGGALVVRGRLPLVARRPRRSLRRGRPGGEWFGRRGNCNVVGHWGRSSALRGDLCILSSWRSPSGLLGTSELQSLVVQAEVLRSKLRGCCDLALVAREERV
mmetsp:Transcript_68732/g.201243  ORF Transcript_68732/g.201243 Transcript_68732/m.201243 type:complete len:246 (-) Transcript_68732:180-917(-)